MEISPTGLDRTLQCILDTRRELTAAVERLSELGIDVDLRTLLCEREGEMHQDPSAELAKLETLQAAICRVTNATHFLRSYRKAFGEGLNRKPLKES